MSSDNYQAVYDAVRSRFHVGDVDGAIQQAAMDAFGQIAFQATCALQEICGDYVRPSAVYRPALYPDGDMWCALLGANLQEGVAGFGKTSDEAMREFDTAFRNQQTPDAIRAAKQGACPMTEQAVKHTPGPWVVTGGVRLVGNPNDDGAWNLYCADINPASESETYLGTICNIQSADHVKGISREEAAANARLIAAAPTMRDYIARKAAEGDAEASSILEAINAGR